MAETDQVLIYATGSDSRLREMCWTLLLQGLATQTDLIDRGRIYLKDGDKRKVSHSGRAVTIVCKRSQLDEVLATMRRAYMDDDLAAYAVPVLASI